MSFHFHYLRQDCEEYEKDDDGYDGHHSLLYHVLNVRFSSEGGMLFISFISDLMRAVVLYHGLVMSNKSNQPIASLCETLILLCIYTTFLLSRLQRSPRF